uniref:Uncharacterized protein n=1 Tax=Anopheles merus TaxID=30066 RepID=A0A182VB78_ANOME
MITSVLLRGNRTRSSSSYVGTTNAVRWCGFCFRRNLSSCSAKLTLGTMSTSVRNTYPPWQPLRATLRRWFCGYGFLMRHLLVSALRSFSRSFSVASGLAQSNLHQMEAYPLPDRPKAGPQIGQVDLHQVQLIVARREDGGRDGAGPVVGHLHERVDLFERTLRRQTNAVRVRQVGKAFADDGVVEDFVQPARIPPSQSSSPENTALSVLLARLSASTYSRQVAGVRIGARGTIETPSSTWLPYWLQSPLCSSRTFHVNM